MSVIGIAPTRVQSKIAWMVKDYPFKVSINVPVTGAASESGRRVRVDQIIRCRADKNRSPDRLGP